MAELKKKKLIDIGFRGRFSMDIWKSYYGRFLSRFLDERSWILDAANLRQSTCNKTISTSLSAQEKYSCFSKKGFYCSVRKLPNH